MDAQKVQPKGKTGRADIALNLINKLYGIERDLKDGSDEQRHKGREQNSLPILGEALKDSRLGGFWKYRVGDYRLISSIEDGALRILVVKIGNRRVVYR